MNKQPALIILLLFILNCSVFGQEVMAKKDFDYNKIFIVHDIHFIKSISNSEFVMLQEEKKGIMKLVHYDSSLNPIWKADIKSDPKLSIPQLFLNEKQAFLLSYNVLDSEEEVTVQLEVVNLADGESKGIQKVNLLQYDKKGPYPRFKLSPDCSKLLIYNYNNHSSKPEFSVFQMADLSLLKKHPLAHPVSGESLYNDFYIDNNGNVFFTYINTVFFKLNGYFIPFGSSEAKVFEHDILFSRPMEQISEIKVHHTGDQLFSVIATGKVNNDLVGVKIIEFDFKNYRITYDIIKNFNIKYLYTLYQEAFKASDNVKKSSLKEPWRLKNYGLEKTYIDSHGNVVLIFEKNLRSPDYHMDFNAKNLPFIYNTKRKLQKSEDIIIMSFSNEGKFLWDHVMQKFQVTRPFSFYMSHVPGLFKDQLNILTWNKNSNENFNVTSINTRTGEVLNKAKKILAGQKYTYNKNYTNWINKNTLVIMTQQQNKKGKREIQVVKLNE